MPPYYTTAKNSIYTISENHGSRVPNYKSN